MERGWSCSVDKKDKKCPCARAIWEKTITQDLTRSSYSVRAFLLASHEQSLLRYIDLVESCSTHYLHSIYSVDQSVSSSWNLLFYDTFFIRQLPLTLIMHQILRESPQNHLIWMSMAELWQAVKHLGSLLQDFPTEGSNTDGFRSTFMGLNLKTLHSIRGHQDESESKAVSPWSLLKRCFPHTNEHSFPSSMSMLSVSQKILDFGFVSFWHVAVPGIKMLVLALLWCLCSHWMCDLQAPN